MKILYNPNDESTFKNILNKEKVYDIIYEKRKDKAINGCSICPCCGIKKETIDELSFCYEVIHNHEIKLKILKTKKVGFFKKIPLVFKYEYNCKKCGAIWESEEWSMEDILYPS